MKKMFAVLLAAVLLVAALPAAWAAEPALAFRADGTFTILQLSDPQDDAYPAWDMLNLIRTAIETADPDLIVLSGDLVEDKRVGDLGVDAFPGQEGVNVEDLSGNLNYEKTRANVETAVDAILSEIESFGVPYVIALGNNDRKVGLSAEDWLGILSAYEHCVFFDESEDAQGGVDYHVTIQNTSGEDAAVVWLMDTCTGGVSDEQVDWYKETSKAVTASNGGEPVPAFVFQHIQCADIGNLFEPCSPADDGARKADRGYVRLNKEIAGGYNFYGYEPGKTSYEFSAWKDCGDVIAAFFGHQHVEGFSGVWDGCEMAKTGPYGFRVFTLHEDDICDYDNGIYTYSGKVHLGTVCVSSEEYLACDTFDSSVFSLFAKFRNLFISLISAIVHLF